MDVLVSLLPIAPFMTASDRVVVASTHSGVNASLHVPVVVPLLLASGNTAGRVTPLKTRAQAPMSVLSARFSSLSAPRKKSEEYIFEGGRSGSPREVRLGVMATACVQVRSLLKNSTPQARSCYYCRNSPRGREELVSDGGQPNYGCSKVDSNDRGHMNQKGNR